MGGTSAAASSSSNRRRSSAPQGDRESRNRSGGSGDSAALAMSAAAASQAEGREMDDVVSPLRGDGGDSVAKGRGKAAASKRGSPPNGTFENSGDTSISTLHPQDRERSSSRDSSNDAGAERGGRGTLLSAAASVRNVVGERADSFSRRYKPPWLVRTLQFIQKYRQLCGRIVNDERVQLFIVVLISINAVMMGVATFDFVSENPKIDSAFEKCDEVFLIIFTIELCMQFIYHGFRLFLDGWLVFDFAIILLSWAFASAQIIRAFRIFRALRLITRVEVMRNLIVALFSVMPRMAAIGLLLFLIFYIFAVMFTQLFKDLFREGLTDFDYFGRLDATFFSLFQVMTLDEWSAMARDVMQTYSWAWAPFVVFVIISGFVVVNLIIAVICDAISALHDDEKAMLHGTRYDSEIELTDEAAEITDQRPLHGERMSVVSEEMTSDDVKRQIELLETQIVELMQIQEQSMKTLDTLTRHVQITRMKDSMEASMSVVDLG